MRQVGRYIREPRVRRPRPAAYHTLTALAPPLPLAAPQPLAFSPAPTADPPSLLQVGADRLRRAPRSALRNSSQATHGVGTHRATWPSPPWSMAKGFTSLCLTRPDEPREAALEALGACPDSGRCPGRVSIHPLYSSAGRAALAHRRLPRRRCCVAQGERAQHVRRS